jgi:hypothetical protein
MKKEQHFLEATDMLYKYDIGEMTTVALPL